MKKLGDFMREFSLSERYELIEEIEREIEKKFDKARTCIDHCFEIISDIEHVFIRTGLIPREEYLETLQLFKASVREITNRLRYRHAVILSKRSETDLGEQVWNRSQQKIAPLWLGESATAADLVFTHNEKRIMVQDKATSGTKYQVSNNDIRKILHDALLHGYYPTLSISFEEKNTFTHCLVPIEEVMSLMKKESFTFTKEKLENGTIRKLTIQDFTDEILSCDFPYMRFNKMQLETWLQRLE